MENIQVFLQENQIVFTMLNKNKGVVVNSQKVKKVRY